ncbi:MAG: lipocalin family protein [bacterium]|nr:lipocalin family protein [bacterium]
MKRLITISFTIILATLSFFAQSSKQTPVRTVRAVDLNKYSGTWYEIAKYPNKFQKNCVGNTTATYTLKGEGKIEVLNRCVQKDGTTKAATAAGKVDDKQTNSKLKVRFAPGFTSFLPFVWADYWVIDLADDYSYAVVGTPDRDYFWILGRTPELKEDVYQNILRRAEKQGFVPGKVVKTPQGIETGKGSVLSQD